MVRTSGECCQADSRYLNCKQRIWLKFPQNRKYFLSKHGSSAVSPPLVFGEMNNQEHLRLHPQQDRSHHPARPQRTRLLFVVVMWRVSRHCVKGIHFLAGLVCVLWSLRGEGRITQYWISRGAEYPLIPLTHPAVWTISRLIYRALKQYLSNFTPSHKKNRGCSS